jgi:hypothetical protein
MFAPIMDTMDVSVLHTIVNTFLEAMLAAPAPHAAAAVAMAPLL